MEKSVGLSISMHTEIHEAIRAIESFKNFYPTSEVKLWGNQPDQLREVSKYLNINGLDSPNYVDKLMKLLHSKEGIDFIRGAEIIREFLEFAQSIYKSMESEYVIYFHPDHKMIRKYKDHLFNAKLEITKVNYFTENQKHAWKIVTGKDLKLEAYGLAGYFHRESLIEVISFLLERSLCNLENLLNMDIDFIFEDLLIPCGFDFLNLSIKDQGLTKELRRRSTLRQIIKRPYLLHQLERIN